jgi:hypothetical protein
LLQIQKGEAEKPRRFSGSPLQISQLLMEIFHVTAFKSAGFFRSKSILLQLNHKSEIRHPVCTR